MRIPLTAAIVLVLATAGPKAAAFGVGPGKRLTAPAKLTAGRYVISVKDASAADNLHFKGLSVNRKTGVAFKGTVKWTVTLKTGTYKLWSDAHPTLKRTLK